MELCSLSLTWQGPKDPKGCVVLLRNLILLIFTKTYLIIVNSLLWGVVWNDQAEPDDEDDAQADGGDGQPTWSPHAIVDARYHIRPTPAKIEFQQRFPRKLNTG